MCGARARDDGGGGGADREGGIGAVAKQGFDGLLRAARRLPARDAGFGFKGREWDGSWRMCKVAARTVHTLI